MKIVEELPPLETLGFARTFAPTMYVANYKDGAWQKGSFAHCKDFSLSPAAKVLHYAQEIFEGLKAFRRTDGSIALFRPQDNIRRMTNSAKIMAMPPFPEDEFLAALKEITKRNEKLTPVMPGSLYLRPTMIATEGTLGVTPASEYCFYVLASPTGGYFGNSKAEVPFDVSIKITKDYIRAIPGGLGSAKTGANYAASLAAVQEAKKEGFANVLFLDALTKTKLEELGGMNVFVLDGETLKTPKLGDTILDGVTRRTVLDLARLDGRQAEETDIPVDDLMEGISTGRIKEVFACGTAASITAITELGWKNERIAIGDKKIGPVATKLYQKLTGIQSGQVQSPVPEWIVPCI